MRVRIPARVPILVAGTPAFDEVKQGSPCNGVSLYGNTGSAGDYGHLGVGVNGWDGCQGKMRAYYQWNLPHLIWGATINTATINASEVYSASCSASATVYLHWAGAIGSGTNWNNQPGYINGFRTGVTYGPSYNPTYCPSNGTVTHGFNVTSPIAKSASAHYGRFTVALAEDSNESSHNVTGFKRFAHTPSLTIQYNHTPNTPAASALSAVTGTDNAGCATTGAYPYVGKTIATNTTVLAAKVSDPDADHLRATFTYWIDGTTTTATVLSGDNLASGTTAKANLPATFTTALRNGQVVAWRVRITDGHATSGYSPTCHFVAEPTAPSQPSIASADGAYPDTDDGGALGAAAGTKGEFALTNTGTTATRFSYGLDIPPSLTSPPADQTTAAAGNAATITVTPAAPGPHTLWVYAADAAGDASSMAAYRFIAGHSAHGTPCANLSGCFNNTAVSPDANMALGSADTYSSYSATDLASAGWTSGGKVTIDGATFTLPPYGSGHADNVVAANQSFAYHRPIPATGATAVMFLAAATNADLSAPGAVDGNTAAPYMPQGTGVAGTYCFDSTDPSAYCAPRGLITFSDGQTQSFDLLAPDWITGPPSLAAVSLPHWNRPAGQLTNPTKKPKIFPLAIPIKATEAGGSIASITLPDVGNADGPGPRLHIFAVSTRNTTTTVSPVPSGETWTGAWANPTEGSYNFQGSNFSNQTLRVALKPSVSGNAIRVKLDNALGSNRLAIGHATVAVASGSPSAVPSGPVTDLTFGGAAGISIPEGGMAYSDPLPYTVTANTWLLVSFSLSNSVPYLVEHSWANTAYTYLSAPGSGDHTTDTAASAFSGSGTFQGWFTDLLTDVDVATSGTPTQAVLGDGLIDAWQPNTNPNGRTSIRISDVLAAAEPTTPSPYGTVAEGIESNYVMADNAQTHNSHPVSGPSALSRIDRDILDQPGLTTVVLDEGLEDILSGTSSDDLTANGYTQLLGYLTASNINVIAFGLTPCDGYAGDGATSTDPCTTAVDTERTAVNGWLNNNGTASGNELGFSPWTTPAQFYIDPDAVVGVTDTANGLTQLDPHATTGDKVNLANPGYAALTTGYLGPQNTWRLDDGADDATTGASTTTAADTASNATNPYLLNNPNVGAGTATLSSTGASWATDPVRGTVLSLEGPSGGATASGPLLTTSGSYSVSAWVNMADTTTYHTVAAQEGTNRSPFYLQYSKAYNAWTFISPSADTASVTFHVAHASSAPALNTWTHLVGTYDASTHTMSLYVNGTLVATATNPTPWDAHGPFDIGHVGTGNGFGGMISDLQAWNYALTPTQVIALYQQVH